MFDLIHSLAQEMAEAAGPNNYGRMLHVDALFYLMNKLPLNYRGNCHIILLVAFSLFYESD